MPRHDPHSYADASQAITTRFEVNLAVDFATRVLTGTVERKLNELRCRRPARSTSTPGGLAIDAVLDHECKRLEFKLHDAQPVLGSRLEVFMRLKAPARFASVTAPRPMRRRCSG